MLYLQEASPSACSVKGREHPLNGDERSHTARRRGALGAGSAADIAAGIIGGAILGGMLAAPYYGHDGPYYAPGYGSNAVGYCMQRFKSYDRVAALISAMMATAIHAREQIAAPARWLSDARF